MKKVPKKSKLKFWLEAVGVALVFLVICPQSAKAQTQTNTFPPTGNAGIGTMTPASLLEVKQSQNAGTTVVIDNGHTAASNAAYSGLFFKQAGVNRFYLGSINDGNTTQFGGAGGVQFWNYANGPILFATNNAERVRIDAAGNVGIGTTTPTERLTVVTQDAVSNAVTQVFAVAHTTTGTPAAGLGAGLSFKAKRSDGSMGYVGHIAGIWEDPTNGTEDGALLFAPVLNSSGFGTERMRITSSGNVGIGNINPQSTVQIGTQVPSASANPLRLSLGASYSNAAGTNFKLRLWDDGIAANVYGLGVSLGSMDFGVSSYRWLQLVLGWRA